ATVTNANGSVTVSDIAGAFQADTRFGSVRGERIKGAADVENSNGSVTLAAVDTTAKVRTSFASVFLSDIGGNVDVQNQNGAISVTEMRGGSCHSIIARTSFSSIKVGVRSGRGYAVSAKTSFGRITSSLPIATTSVSDETLVGTIGSGGCRLELVNSNGNITIDSE
ncbi:MAG TPA: DUF4097 family beta strand repeat-containing protein, partial [Thermoanaerobaculia bacterium]|nr:DUF4097 family beta strand repeat-containing protein [Thermoanaerobaculia bacterium]